MTYRQEMMSQFVNNKVSECGENSTVMQGEEGGCLDVSGTSPIPTELPGSESLACYRTFLCQCVCKVMSSVISFIR